MTNSIINGFHEANINWLPMSKMISPVKTKAAIPSNKQGETGSHGETKINCGMYYIADSGIFGIAILSKAKNIYLRNLYKP